MSDHIQTDTRAERFREILDWTVFSLGVVSLAFAIAATLVTHANHWTSADLAPVPPLEATALPGVL